MDRPARPDEPFAVALSALLVRGAEVYAPKPLGIRDVLLLGDRVAAIGADLRLPPWAQGRVIEARGAVCVPGFLDQHVHIAGGGGEGGPVTRTPEIAAADLAAAGVTTVVGLLGTDGTTRSVHGLLAKARQLRALGITAYIYTGAYQVPTRTLTDSPRTDIVLVNEVLGVGEIAVSDHRGTHPSLDELAHLAGEAHVGGLLAGKAGVLHLHVGDGARRLDALWALVDRYDVPRATLVPTHLNRSAALLDAADAWLAAGGWVDLTTGIVPSAVDPAGVAAHSAALQWVRPDCWDRVSFSSDAMGSAPRFDASGSLIGLDVGHPRTLFQEIQALIAAGLSWEQALGPVTTTPARILHLEPRGSLVPGGPADLVLIRDGAIETVVGQGRVLVQGGRPIAALDPFATGEGTGERTAEP